jgi:hypothetical protein
MIRHPSEEFIVHFAKQGRPLLPGGLPQASGQLTLDLVMMAAGFK